MLTMDPAVVCVWIPVLLASLYGGVTAQDRVTECEELYSLGEFSSPGYPQNYPPRLTQCWVLMVSSPAERYITLTFDDFALENSVNCIYDSVNVYSDLEQQQLIAGPLCGHDIPEVITSNSTALYVWMRTDPADQDSGFHAYFSTSELDEADEDDDDDDDDDDNDDDGDDEPQDTSPTISSVIASIEAQQCSSEHVTSVIHTIITHVRQHYDEGGNDDILSQEQSTTAEATQPDVCQSAATQTLQLSMSMLSGSGLGYVQSHYSDMSALLATTNVEHLRRAHSAMVTLYQWILNTGFPQKPLSDTTYVDTWQFFVELQRDDTRLGMMEISMLANLFGESLSSIIDQGFIKFFTTEPETLSRICHSSLTGRADMYTVFPVIARDYFFYSFVDLLEMTDTNSFYSMLHGDVPLLTKSIELLEIMQQRSWL